jgi:hypothetical protein
MKAGPATHTVTTALLSLLSHGRICECDQLILIAQLHHSLLLVHILHEPDRTRNRAGRLIPTHPTAEEVQCHLAELRSGNLARLAEALT